MEKTFSARNIIEKTLLVEMRSMPNLDHSLKYIGRGFQAMSYTKKKWLCASESKKSCFLALPFVLSWNLYDLDRERYNNMQGFLCDCKKHEKAKSHINCVQDVADFCTE